jgi:enoyl-CoA hydratase/carnithine racemase
MSTPVKTGENVDVKRDGAVATVVMHRKGINAIAPDLLEDLRAAFEELGADAEVRVVVLASEYEKYFSVGADLTEMGSGVDRSAPDAQDQIAATVARMARAGDAIENCPKPVIAAINGHAMGGGCEIALCCDYRIMVDNGHSRIGQTERRFGIIPGFGGTQRLPRLVGKANALPMLLEGRQLSAKEAEAIGLVDKAVPPEQFDATVRELAEQFAKAPTVALAMIKDAVNRGLDLPMNAAMEIEAQNFARASLSEDAVVGIMAFLTKQEPEFKGR